MRLTIGPGTRVDKPPPPGHSIADPMSLTRYAESRLPTANGSFRIVVYRPGPDGSEEHVAMVMGDIAGDDVLTRVHSSCFTGEVLGSQRCDCRAQLDAALARIAALGRGVLVYLVQEGRGIGLTNKIRAYALQDQGHDTIEANRLLGFGDDERDYRVAAEMLRALRVKSVRLMTNNPAKLSGLREHGVRVAGRIPLVMAPNRHNAAYLATKERRAGHWLSPLAQAEAG